VHCYLEEVESSCTRLDPTGLIGKLQQADMLERHTKWGQDVSLHYMNMARVEDDADTAVINAADQFKRLLHGTKQQPWQGIHLLDADDDAVVASDRGDLSKVRCDVSHLRVGASLWVRAYDCGKDIRSK
jgi:hypothetical protein